MIGYTKGGSVEWYQKLKNAREYNELSCRQVEELTGISNAYINQIENGQIKDPSFFKVHKLLILYNLDYKELLYTTKINNIIDWLLSIEGVEAIKKALEQSEKAIFDLKLAMKVDSDILHRPMDI